MIVDNEIISGLMERMSQIEVESRDTYKIDDKRVPRVTEVLSAMLHEDGLMHWSNSLGWKRISYKAFMKEAADKGTYSHMAIEKYLRQGYLDLNNDMNIPNDRIFETVQSCMDGFIQWWRELHKKYKKIEIVFLEETMIHEYFGGTCDCLLKLDGKYWLIDFKTSNHMNFNYSLQLSAYRFLLKELKGIEISGATILRLSKTDHCYEEYSLDFEDKTHLEFIINCEQLFLTLVAAYKMRLYCYNQYHHIYGLESWRKKK